MYNCNFVESIITVVDSSRRGLNYDTVHVEYLFSTDTTIPQNDLFYVPGMDIIPENILKILKLGNFQFVPIPKSEVSIALSNYMQEQEEHKTDELLADSMLAISTQYMKPITAALISNNFYRLSYDYSIYPEQDGSYLIYAKLPIKGFQLPQGGQTRFIVVLPINAKYDSQATKGIALNNQEIQEQVANAANGRTVISFFYQNDPEFIVKYYY